MIVLQLALKSLRSRSLTTSLTVLSIALSVTLLVGIEMVRAGVRESFAGTIRGTDLIVGARGGTLQVLLSSVFGIGSPAGSVKLSTFERWKSHPAVKWAVPYSLGDSHRGFRVVGTTPEFYERYRFRQDARITFTAGKAGTGDEDVVIGSEVADRLQYTVGSPVTISHGMQDIGTSTHEAHPFKVVGVLARTFTPIDRSVYVTLEGLEAMHEAEPASGPGSTQPMGANAPAMPGASPPPAMPGASPPPSMPGADAPPIAVAAPSVQDEQITSFFIGTKNRFEALMLQREMNTDLREPLTAVIPGVALGELWNNIGNAEVGLRLVAVFAVAIGLTGMLVSLYSSLDARRREMAILRSIGAGPRTIISLLVLESGVLALLGCIIGVGLVYLGLALAQGPIEGRFGLHLAMRALGATEWTYVAVVIVAGVLIGFVPAWKAYRTSLADGLSPRA
ncbi:MAG TPA: ABC transporter permease [Gemmatimonas sp.]|nr:ABC transporter permease [Gemmatimonas sp.]